MSSVLMMIESRNLLIFMKICSLLVGWKEVGSLREAPWQWVEERRVSDRLRWFWICAIVGTLANRLEVA